MMASSTSSQQPAHEPAEGSLVRCPFCGSLQTQLEATFGTTHAYSQFFCQSCRTPFEWIKWEEKAASHDLPAFLQK